jgi:hypothetical protein
MDTTQGDGKSNATLAIRQALELLQSAVATAPGATNVIGFDRPVAKTHDAAIQQRKIALLQGQVEQLEEILARERKVQSDRIIAHFKATEDLRAQLKSANQSVTQLTAENERLRAMLEAQSTPQYRPQAGWVLPGD